MNKKELGIIEVQLPREELVENYKSISKLNKKYYKDNIELQQRINKAIEYINNNQLFEEEWDYDSDDEPYSWGCNDEIATSDLLSILKGEDNDI